jgi:3',5'-cyclic AMP phosphodiesterase CpdA
LATNPHKWSIVLMHAPPFATRPGRSNPAVVARWLPILEAHDVDLVLTGHDHSYARGFHGDPNGPVFASSVSGPKFYPATDADWVANGATRVAWATGTATYQVITITGDQLSYRAVVSARSSTSTSPFGPGGVLDHFVIDKSQGTKVVR